MLLVATLTFLGHVFFHEVSTYKAVRRTIALEAVQLNVGDKIFNTLGLNMPENVT